jgi:hypothetical protein
LAAGQRGEEILVNDMDFIGASASFCQKGYSIMVLVVWSWKQRFMPP